MTGQIAFASVINIAFAICTFFAASILMPIAGLLATLLIIFGCFFSLGTIVQIVQAYRPTKA